MQKGEWTLLAESAGWQLRLFDEPKQEIDLALIEKEILSTCLVTKTVQPTVRAFVLECTDLPRLPPQSGIKPDCRCSTSLRWRTTLRRAFEGLRVRLEDTRWVECSKQSMWT